MHSRHLSPDQGSLRGRSSCLSSRFSVNASVTRSVPRFSKRLPRGRCWDCPVLVKNTALWKPRPLSRDRADAAKSLSRSQCSVCPDSALRLLVMQEPILQLYSLSAMRWEVELNVLYIMHCVWPFDYVVSSFFFKLNSRWIKIRICV